MMDGLLDNVTNVQLGSPMCRDRHGVFNASFFTLWACSLCYHYLVHDVQRHLAMPRNSEHTTAARGSGLPHNVRLHHELLPAVSEDDGALCEALGGKKCQRLASCCKAAARCCAEQIVTAQSDQTAPTLADGCPMTWDGYACFPSTPSGHVAEVTCPLFISDIVNNGVATKRCTENGTWWQSQTSGLEWTDYISCASLERYRILYYVSITSNILSLLCLLPASYIFIKYTQLRRQHRVRIHINLFLSFILTNCSWLAWDHVIYKDRLENSSEMVVMHQHIGGCRLLYMMTRYSWTCNFVWMSLEGFHLYRLISHAFEVPRSIYGYYFIGWLVPAAPIGLYSTLRALRRDPGCWIEHDGYLECLVYGPNLLCILLNIVFLTHVLRIMLTQLQTQRNEPSNYRRALKATLVLVPLFGLQLVLVIYRPQEDSGLMFLYEIVAKIISNSQGIAVTVVLCFMNVEVQSLLRCPRVWDSTKDTNRAAVVGLDYPLMVRRGSSQSCSQQLDRSPQPCTDALCRGQCENLSPEVTPLTLSRLPPEGSLEHSRPRDKV